jgi:mannose-6-phosphate isomerase-like protein (cupin superfamily)
MEGGDNMALHQLTGLSVADTGNPIQTYDQLGGTGIVFNKALAIPMHLGYPWHSLEYVVISPVTDGQESSVGEHLQYTDEIYYIHRGTGVLTTNGTSCDVAPGFLAIAPRGTRHGIRNTSFREELAILVVELVPPQDGYVSQPREIPSLPALLAGSASFHPASLGTREARLRVATVDLSCVCSAPWGRLALVEIPPGSRVHPYCEEAHDENLFILAGNAAIAVAEERFYSWEHGLNVLVPRGLPRAIANRSSVEPLLLLSVLVCREGGEGEQP